MKLKNLVLAAAIGLGSVAMADEGQATEPTPWGVEELKMVQNLALDKFKKDLGEDVFKAVTGFSIERKSQPTSATAKVIYKNAEGVKVTETYFCHVHSHEDGTSEIDCH